MTRTQRTYVVAAAVAAIVTAANASQGAYFSQSWGWVALAFLVPSTVLLILDRVSVPGRLMSAYVVLVGAVAVWIAMSAIWSLSVGATARELERMLVYVSVAFAVAFVLRRGDGAGVVGGAMVGAALITGYGLATRLFPDRFDPTVDRFTAARLAEPLGYWNAFGLLAALGAILAVGVVVHGRRRSLAVAAGALLPLFVVSLYLSFSRGSWLALFFGLGAAVALDPRRLTVLWSLVFLVPASACGVLVASRQDALTSYQAPAADVAHDGHRFAAVTAALIAASGVLALAARLTSTRLSIPARVRRGGAIVLLGMTLVAVLATVAALGGPSALVTDVRARFEAAPVATPNFNDRLFSISGTGRADMIRVAWEAAMQHPLRGTGAGTYELTWYEHRPTVVDVRDAHSLYVEAFGELGLVGLALLVAALAVPLMAGIRARRSRYVAPACGAYIAWLAASGLDWHWEMVALTTTAFLIGGVGLVSAERRANHSIGAGGRLALVGISATLSVLAVWSLVGNQALFAGRDAITRKDWSEARSDARRARALLFWSHEPDFVLADAAAGLGDREATLKAYRDAVDKDPNNWFAWIRLARVAHGAERADAYHRVHELNPLVEGVPVR
jgi:O-antigen ligase/polysaccharide polymerase Wzy-like membrane protein